MAVKIGEGKWGPGGSSDITPDFAATGYRWANFGGGSQAVVGDALRLTWDADPVGSGYYGPTLGFYVDDAGIFSNDFYVEFDAKFPGNVNGCKFVKFFGRRSVEQGYSNATFNLLWGTGEFANIIFTDGTDLEGDAGRALFFSGGNSAANVGRAWGTAVVSTPQGHSFSETDWGNTWHHFKFRYKQNSGTTSGNEVADGVFYVEIDGQVYLSVTNIFNRNPNNIPGIDNIQFGGWSQDGGGAFDLDIRNVVVSTGGFMDALPDTTPDAFTIPAVTNAALNTTITSAAVTLAGYDTATALTVTGGTASIAGGAYSASPGNISPGQSFTARVQSSASPATAMSATVTVGGVSAQFTATTAGSVPAVPPPTRRSSLMPTKCIVNLNAPFSDVDMWFNTEGERLAAGPFAESSIHALAYVFATKSYYRLVDPAAGQWVADSIVSTGSGVLVYSPEAFGAVGNGIADDTVPMTQWLQQFGTGSASLVGTPGKVYAVASTLQFSSVFNVIDWQGARVQAAFGNAYSTPLFANDRNPTRTCKVVMYTPHILGNCQFLNMGFDADTANAGLSLAIYDLYMNTLDGNRRPGTSTYKLRQVDFVAIARGEVWNTDLGFDIGDAANFRECTQVYIANYGMNQTNATMKLQGVSKATISGIDALKTCAGFSLENRVELITFDHCHVEGLAMTGYQTPSSRVSADSTGVGYSIVDDSSAKNIVFNQCDTLDIQGSGGAAVTSARVGKEDRTNPKGRSVYFKNCKFSPTMNGSTAYKPFTYRGRFVWEGAWDFQNLPGLVDGLSYIDCDVKDSHSAAYKPRSLLQGNTVLSLLSGIGAVPPTITENDLNSQFHPSDTYHQVVFNEAGYRLHSLLSLPYGWNTLDVCGYWIAGNPILVVQLNGGSDGLTFTEVVRLQFNGLNDAPRRWRVLFWNPTPQASYRVGLTCQNVGDTCRIQSIDCYPGLPRNDVPNPRYQLVAALPVPSERWFGTNFVLRTVGQDDTAHVCMKNAAGVYVTKPLT